MPRCPTLYVEWLDGRIRYRLDHPERDGDFPLQREVLHPLDAATLAALLDGADTLLDAGEHAEFADAARQRGAVMFRALIPQALRDPLRALDGPLSIATSLPGVPWELLHDGEQFWGLRHAIGRRILLDRDLPPQAPPPARGPRLRTLIIGADPTGDLPMVRAEVERLAATFDPVADLTVLSGPLATFDAVTGALGHGFDLVHFCGHVRRDAAGEPVLWLADGKHVARSTIETILAGHPIVVLNGCASARGDGAARDAWEPGVSSLAHAFLFGGASAVVGTLCPIADRHAASLADELYRRVLDGAAVGVALREARRTLAAHHPTSPAWLSFVLFGNPTRPLIEIATGTEAARTRLITRRGLLAGGALAGAGALATWLRPWTIAPPHPPRPAAPIAVGVMAIRVRSGQPPAWMAEVTRSGLNTLLSKVDALQVYSRQKIDFLREKEGLTEIEVAERLHMNRMLSTTIDLESDRIALEVEIVDVHSGVLLGTEHVSGPPSHLIELQNQLVERILPRLGVELTDDARRAMLADRTNEMLDGYRRLAETLGAPAAPTIAPSTTAPTNDGSSWIPWPGRAWADGPSDEDGVRAALEKLRAALEAESLDRLAAVLNDLSAAQRDAYRDYFANAEHLTVALDRIDIVIAGNDALATFTRRDVFTDRDTGREMRLEVRLSSTLVKRDGRWRITALQKPS